MGVEVVEPVVCLVEERIELRETGLDALLADGKEFSLRAIDGLLDLGWILVADAGYSPGRADEVPQDSLALDDPCVLDRMNRGRGRVRQTRQISSPADRLELVTPLERLRDRDDVDRFAPFEELEHRPVDRPVRLPVEVSRPQELGHLDDSVAVDEDRAEHGLLGLETLRWQAIDHALPNLTAGCVRSSVIDGRAMAKGAYPLIPSTTCIRGPAVGGNPVDTRSQATRSIYDRPALSRDAE
jgi:hypothetical protein